MEGRRGVVAVPREDCTRERRWKRKRRTGTMAWCPFVFVLGAAPLLQHGDEYVSRMGGGGDGCGGSECGLVMAMFVVVVMYVVVASVVIS